MMDKVYVSAVKIWVMLLIISLLATGLVPGFAAETDDQQKQLDDGVHDSRACLRSSYKASKTAAADAENTE